MIKEMHIIYKLKEDTTNERIQNGKGMRTHEENYLP